MNGGRWVLTGRAQELAFARDRLLGDGSSGVIITGAAGVGKTRLAVEVADALPEHWVVERFVATASTREIPFGAMERLFGTAPDRTDASAVGAIEASTVYVAVDTVTVELTLRRV